MAGVKTILILFVGLFVLFLAKSAGSNDCRANQEVSCESLRSPKGFTYTVPLNITCLHENCEQGWYFQNGTFIVDSTPNAGGERPPTVQDVTSKNLTVTVCEKLQWQLNCGTVGAMNCECNIGFTVTDTKQPPAHDSHDKQDDNHNDNGLPQWWIVLIGIVGAGAFIAILFWRFRRSKSFSCSKQNDVV